MGVSVYKARPMLFTARQWVLALTLRISLYVHLWSFLWQYLVGVTKYYGSSWTIQYYVLCIWMIFADYLLPGPAFYNFKSYHLTLGPPRWRVTMGHLHQFSRIYCSLLCAVYIWGSLGFLMLSIKIRVILNTIHHVIHISLEVLALDTLSAWAFSIIYKV